MTGTEHEGHNICRKRAEQGNMLGIFAQNELGNLQHVLEASRRL